MAWSNAAQRSKFTAEKSHSLSFAIRVEDRLHANVILPTDEALFTVRPVDYTVGFDDADITVGTDAVEGNGVRAEGVLVGTGDATVLQFDVQAAAMNLDPELDYTYAISYVRDGYSITVLAGVFQVLANPTNRAALTAYSGTNAMRTFVAAVDGPTLLTVTATMPLPQKGDPGNGSYTVAQELSEVVGESVTIPLTEIIAPGGRPVQVGDVLFSTMTRGVFATIQSISLDLPASALVVTRQVYAQQTLKALMDTGLHTVTVSPNLEDVDHEWTVLKSNVPLPVDYDYQVGDLLFSHSVTEGFAGSKKLLISRVESQTATELNVITKIVFPMFLDVQDLLDNLVPDTRTVNDVALDTNITLTEDHIPAGVTNAKFSQAEKTKLGDLPTNSTLNTSLAGKAANNHTHAMSSVDGLVSALAGKVGSTTIASIWTGPQALYDAISPKRADTLYLIQG